MNIAVDTALRQGAWVRDMIDLGNHFSDFDFDNLETYSLPTVPYPPDPYWWPSTRGTPSRP